MLAPLQLSGEIGQLKERLQERALQFNALQRQHHTGSEENHLLRSKLAELVRVNDQEKAELEACMTKVRTSTSRR
jgi:hypothetical protein